MNYTLQIVRGRSEASSLKLVEGVNSIGRLDDCLIRIRSAQVSRRHCELIAQEGNLLLRDLGSSNGTFVNGKRVLGQQALQPGDVLTIGGVTLRIDQAGANAKPPASASPKPGPHDTSDFAPLAVDDDVEVEADFDDEEFEVAIENDDHPEHIDIIPLDDEPTHPKPPSKAVVAKQAPAPAKKEPPIPSQADTGETTGSTPKPQTSPQEEDAVAQFLMDLKLDDDD